jgi:hypothetical protein
VPDHRETIEEPLICPGYTRLQGATEPPSVAFENGRLVSASCGGERAASPQPHDSISGWTLMATFAWAGRWVAAFEQLDAQDGSLAYVAADGLLRSVPKSLEPTSEGDTGLRFHGIQSWYKGHPKADVLPNSRDVLREELLRAGRDPKDTCGRTRSSVRGSQAMSSRSTTRT